MCGIAGIYHHGAHVEDGKLNAMTKAIYHRGPDDAGYYVKDKIGLGVRRLSIIDVTGGHQPISNEDGTVWIVFNGEIYNFQQIRKELESKGHRFATRSDTETIVHLYEEYGDECPNYLRGMFAFAIWDERKQKLFIARDRLGIKPLFYAWSPEKGLVFASEIKSLLAAFPELSQSVDQHAISLYFAFWYIPTEHTIFSHIRKLPPGHFLTLESGRLAIKRYWSVIERVPQKWMASEAEYVERLLAMLQEAVRVRLLSEVPLGAFLSGGIDSSLVVGLMSRIMNRPVKTFSIGFEEADFDELRYARLVARHFQTEHHEFVVKPDAAMLTSDLVRLFDEPFGDASAIPTFLVAKLARRNVTVTLSGDGGDELFAGYERYKKHKAMGMFGRLPHSIRASIRAMASLGGTVDNKLARRVERLYQGSQAPFPASYYQTYKAFTDEFRHEIFQPAWEDGKIGEEVLSGLVTSGNQIENIQYMDLLTYLPDDILAKVDRTSMANSLEVRVPFLDHELVQLVWSIPVEQKLRGFTSKYILKKAAASIIPQKIIRRRKQGFGVPIAKWFRHELKEVLHDALLSRQALQRGYFKRQGLESVLKEHLDGKWDYSGFLWGLLFFESWHRVFQR